MALIEFGDPVNMKMFVGAIGRLGIVAKDYVSLALLIKDSDNFEILKNRVTMNGVMYYIKIIAMTYSEVAMLFYDHEYKKAGNHFAKEVFPKKYKSRGVVEWEALPYYNDYEGDFSSGLLSGLIYEVTGQINYDNLASCIKPAQAFEETFSTATILLL